MPVAALCFLRLTSWRSSANQRALGGLGSPLCTRCSSLLISCLSQTKPSVLCVRNKAEGIHNSMEEKPFFFCHQFIRCWEMRYYGKWWASGLGHLLKPTRTQTAADTMNHVSVYTTLWTFSWTMGSKHVQQICIWTYCIFLQGPAVNHNRRAADLSSWLGTVSGCPL